MKKKYVISLDQGTTSSRCIIFDKQGNIVSKAQREFPQIYPCAGWVEHAPGEILAGQLGVLSEAVALAGIDNSSIASMGITNQRETVIVWDKKTGKPVYNAIVWQCRRTAEYCNKLKEDGLEPFIYGKTGLYLDAYFSASKLKWILDNVSGARSAAEKGDILFGTVDTYLLWHLTKGKVHATEYTNASRTMLFNIHTLEWDEELLKLFGIPQKMLPKVLPSASDFGTTEEGACGVRVPVGAMLGDQQAALYGQLCVEKGDIKNTYGTGCFMLMNTGGEAVISKRGLLTTVAAGKSGEPVYALEGSVFVGGAAVQWLRDEMRLIRTSADSETYARRVPDTNGIYVVPSFVGLGAPYWDSDARGIVTGLTRGVKKEHFIRAALESIAYQTMDVLRAMQSDSNQKISALSVDGGASANNFLMQFQSDISGILVKRPKVVETTALGVGYLSGLTHGLWNDFEELKKNTADYTVFTPAMDENRRKELIEGWGAAIYKARAK